MDNAEIEYFIRELQREEFQFKKGMVDFRNQPKMRWWRGVLGRFRYGLFVLRSFVDYLQLLLLVAFREDLVRRSRIVYTARNLCVMKGGKLQDRVVRPLFRDGIIFINHSKEYRIDTINGSRVYNLGGVVKVGARFLFRSNSALMRTFRSYRMVNDSVLRHLDGGEVFTLCYYDMNGLSLVFSKHRSRMRLCEVQHGSIVNYPPYAKPAPTLVADVFFVKNRQTVDYLRGHLCRGFNPEYQLIPYPKVDRSEVPGIHVFYASTVEFNGLHPVFTSFLCNNCFRDLHVIVRLHPREREKEPLYRKQLLESGVEFEFDRSENWLTGNLIKNMIVVSPWSSTIEDAFDNGFYTVIIDSVGQERYRHLLEHSNRCVYSDDLGKTLRAVYGEFCG